MTASNLLFAPLTLFSAYALTQCYANIVKLQKYEDKAKKAAEWSKTAAERLRKTRTTQTSGTLARQFVVSLATSALFCFPTTFSPSIRWTLALGNTVFLGMASVHMGRFWNEGNQTRVPFATEFNEAVKGSEYVVQCLWWAAAAWGTLALI